MLVVPSLSWQMTVSVFHQQTAQNRDRFFRTECGLAVHSAAVDNILAHKDLLRYSSCRRLCHCRSRVALAVLSDSRRRVLIKPYKRSGGFQDQPFLPFVPSLSWQMNAFRFKLKLKVSKMASEEAKQKAGSFPSPGFATVTSVGSSPAGRSES